ncbi:hypothetical protein GTA08_BOTSDO07227 [Botryosphaeria dothidea]|uniref:Uncharacterized protein n=1 Tax=Botryosphaeria dothidea TaxID=55169 RepID=A0A8H4MZA8_9PEZI|nr:hypothetical protein GTA08_BOTSDO11423 [Botryosphaeria dothidea]KAF4305134.1 hypothetical protein GTA08_BOTSDO07227 [Botryosphaeria dothidea]
MSGQSRSGTKDPISTRDFALSADQDFTNPARRNASRQQVDRRPSLHSSGQVATPASSSGFATPRSTSHAQQAALATAPPARVAAQPPASSQDRPPRSVTTSEFWDWEDSIDFTDVADFYEPQGELTQAQYQSPGQDFSFPHAISASEPSLSANSPQLTPSACSPSLHASNPLASLPFAFLPPPARASTSASAQPAMKRKDRSESASIGSSTALPYGNDSIHEPAAKRTATSRSSSVAEESPTVTQGPSFVNPRGGSPDGLDIRQSGVSFAPELDSGADSSSSAAATPAAGPPPSVGGSGRPGWVTYARPYADDSAHELVLEISGESARLDVHSMRAAFHGDTKARISSLFQVIASKMGLPATQPLGLMMLQTGGGVAAQPASPANSGVSGDRVKIAIGHEASIELDGTPIFVERRERDIASMSDPQASLLPRLQDPRPDDKITSIDELPTEWVVARGQWRLRVQPARYDGESRVEVVMHAVKLEAQTGERARNVRRGFLA